MDLFNIGESLTELLSCQIIPKCVGPDGVKSEKHNNNQDGLKN